MLWPSRLDVEHFFSRMLSALYLTKLWIFDRPLRRIEKIKVRSELKASCGFDATVWRSRDGYFYMVTDFHGGFPHDWKAPESSKEISPAMYIDVLQRYLTLVSYVERLNTGESNPGEFSIGEDIVPDDS